MNDKDVFRLLAIICVEVILAIFFAIIVYRISQILTS